MVKVRMNTADVVAEVACLRRLIGMRCVNVYDISPKTYLFKLMNSSGVTETGESEKVLLLMESGVRLHTTAYIRDKSTTPSGFTLKLRKHIRSKRLEDIRQLGYDRIILFQFGQGSQAHYIILELYAQGNILLADSNFTVLTLLRSHRDDDKGLAIMSRHRYPVEHCRAFQRTTLTKLQEALSSLMESSNMDMDESIENNAVKSDREHLEKAKKTAKSNEKVKDAGGSAKSTLKTVLGNTIGYGPALSEHMILDAGLSPNLKIDQFLSSQEDGSVHTLSLAVSRFEDWVSNVMSGHKVPEGFILMQNKIAGKKELVSTQDPILGKIYDEFCPILLHQFQMREFVKFETFDAAMDEFYSKIETQRLDQQKKAKEMAAFQKLSKIRADQENRVEALKKEVDHSVKMGELIEYNLEDVDAAIMAVRVALAKGMDWGDLARMIKEEKRMGNPIAGLIDKLHLERNSITLLLSKNLDDMDDDEITEPVDKVDVDLALSAHANARRWYELKKKQELKQEKTVSAHEKAFKAAERKTKLQLAQEKTVAAISHVRKVHWFEKFNWFISSENYLVISGRDAQQNEMIVKRYMSKGDLYVHADLHGASSTVIKNHNPENPIPPLTLNQAGCYTVCQSKAWDSKIVTSAWWVYPHQVSKTAPTGEYLTVGSFMIRGKKNFLPPHPLVMGFGILFRLDESSLGPHVNERRVRGEEDEAYQPPREDSEDTDKGQEHIPSTTNKVLIERNQEEESASPFKLEEILDSSLSLGPSKRVEVESEGSVPNSEDSKITANGNPRIAKAERRKAKKDENDRNSKAESGENSKTVGTKITRGQKGKLKRMKEKYADQDDEERRIRMALLASAGKGNSKANNESKEREATAEEVKTTEAGLAETLKLCYKCKKPGHLSRDCREQLEEAAGVSESQAATAADVPDVALIEEDDEEDKGMTEEGKEKTSELDYLTGIPLPGDILLYAVPVCGPYNALQNYKFRVKITPGAAKKGKAAKTATNLFCHIPEATSREKELIKACTDSELVAAIIGGVKITAPGLSQLKQKQKKEKKSSKSM